MEVQWFPGHMAKTLRAMREKIKWVDLLIELADARIPQASRNPEIARIGQHKPSLLILTKADLASASETRSWVQSYAERGEKAVVLDSLSKKGLNRIVPECQELLSEKMEREWAKGKTGRPLRAMIVGIPNVGKSTLINALAGHKVVKTEDRPGVTRAPQWIRMPGLELMDMPGVLWPKIQTSEDQLLLAATGAIKEEVLSVEEIAVRTFSLICSFAPDLLEKRYKLEYLQKSFLRAQKEEYLGTISPHLLERFEEAARNRGCLLKGGRIDLLRFSKIFLDELRGGKIGRITLQLSSQIDT